MRHFLLLLAIFLLLVMNVHSKSKPKPSSANITTTRVEYSEQQFMKWVNFVGGLKHSVFKTAKNKLFPSFTLTVDQNPALGDFTTIQDAIDSLPSVNLCPSCHQCSCRDLLGEGNNSTVEILHYNTRRRSRQNNSRVGRHGPNTRSQRPPSRHIWVRHVCSKLTIFHSQEHHIQEHDAGASAGSGGEASGGVPDIGGHGGVRGVQIPGGAGHAVRSRGQALLQRLLHRGIRRFHLRQRPLLVRELRRHAIAPVTGAVTAQGRNSMLDDTGFSFLNCRVTGSGALYLGRAWGPFSRVVFAYTYMDNIIIPKGWFNWGDPSREMTVFYGQYKCSGPGANFAGRVSWSRELTDAEAQPFLSLTFIDGSEWITM